MLPWAHSGLEGAQAEPETESRVERAAIGFAFRCRVSSITLGFRI